MGVIAKGEITLSPVNDAYTVLLTPSSCSISADFDGSNPALSNAKGTITVKRGTKSVPFKVNSIEVSASGINVTYATQEVTELPFAVTNIPNTVLDGSVTFHITTQDGFNYSTEVQFSFNIVRESTMLDWIQDWEGSKTKIGGTYIMTPKLFVGKKEAVLDMTGSEPIWKEGALTGVYIGPDLLASGESSVGIYGYLKDKKIFHINADGGFIGGWTFNEGGLQSSNGVVNILSEGSVYAQNPKSETPYWGIYADGRATFANGNVKFYANGSAEYQGKITAQSGAIGGWIISSNQLHKGRVIIDSANGYIGINASSFQKIDADGNVAFPETPTGGVKMWYNSAADFGLAGWDSTGNKLFQLGSNNLIAGWNFNYQAIWTGNTAPSLTQGSYTSKTDAITIAPNGIRSYKWYVDSNGTASFVGGSVKFNTENAEMFGWLMRSGRFSSKHAALISDVNNGGLYVSIADISEVGVGSLRTTINNNGGIYIYSDGSNAEMKAFNKSGSLGFSLSTTGINSISSWSFDSEAIYIGSKVLSSNGFAQTAGSMVLSSAGIFGNKWKLLADGSGALANSKIVWDKDGNLTVDAKISANNITSGTISTADITNADKTWALYQDGSGFLAGGNISWKIDGTTSFNGEIKATSGTIGGFTISSNSIGIDKDGGRNGLFLYDDMIGFNGTNMQTIIGAYSSLGTRMLGRFSNTQEDYLPNYGIIFNVSGSKSRQNYAFCGVGSGILSGLMCGYSIQFVDCAQNTVKILDLIAGNKYLVSNMTSNTGVGIPLLSSVRSALNISNSTPFGVTIVIAVNPDSTGNVFVYGKNSSVNGMNTSSHAQLYNTGGSAIDSMPVKKGQCIPFFLTYDGSSYKAFVVSEQY